ncbi:hypothetical protein RB195_005061 [Necator americanus]|uniref:Secreted protein n=1 Tax=Necator americanus TaxID=51031 RepID=A0ABR1BL07_NECAM
MNQHLYICLFFLSVFFQRSEASFGYGHGHTDVVHVPMIAAVPMYYVAHPMFASYGLVCCTTTRKRIAPKKHYPKNIDP